MFRFSFSGYYPTANFCLKKEKNNNVVVMKISKNCHGLVKSEWLFEKLIKEVNGKVKNKDFEWI